MISLQKDLFCRLVISAKAFRALEFQKKKQFENLKRSISDLENKDYETPKIDLSKAETSKVSSKKLDEAIIEILENPEIEALKKELDKVEGMFLKIKDKHDDMDFVYRIEKKIEQLKTLIEEKSY